MTVIICHIDADADDGMRVVMIMANMMARKILMLQMPLVVAMRMVMIVAIG